MFLSKVFLTISFPHSVYICFCVLNKNYSKISQNTKFCIISKSNKIYFFRPKSLALTTPSQLRVTPQPSQKYIDVGGGPQNLPPTYHTIIQLPGGSFKHKKSSTHWKNIFFKVPRNFMKTIYINTVKGWIEILNLCTFLVAKLLYKR